MFQNLDEIQKLGTDNVESAVASFNALAKTCQAMTIEIADYSKKSFEHGAAAMERLAGAKSFDKAIEIQTDFAKTAYEGLVAEMTKLGALCTDLASEAYQPFEGRLGKVTKA